MVRKLITALAGRSIARSIGGVTAGPAGAMIGGVAPMLIPRLARRLGPVGMAGTAIASMALVGWADRHRKRRAALRNGPPTDPTAQLGTTPLANPPQNKG